LSTAVHKAENPEEFTQRYQSLLNYYHLKGCKTQPSSPNENGDVEQRNYRFKQAVDQSLMLRGSRDFDSREAYALFLRQLFVQLNAGRQKRFREEEAVLGSLPSRRLESCTKLEVRVGPSSTIRVKHNVYSVDSRLIRERVMIRLYAEYLEVCHGQRCLERIPRLRGCGRHHIQYRHIIDWLRRKPGAFANYRYRSDLFPSSRFRMAYDALQQRHTAGVATKEYLHILELAAKDNEAAVDNVLRVLIDRDEPISAACVADAIRSGMEPAPVTDVTISPICLTSYDQLLQTMEVAA
jgi:hypothetical protein